MKWKNFLKVLNEFYDDCDKTSKIKDHKFIIHDKITNKQIEIKNLSSGERQLFFILLKASNLSTHKSILLMDEPEISLHLKWQECLIAKIKELNKTCQLIIVTHSPSIMMNGWMDCFVELDKITNKVV